jgi:hypothetical protein
MDSPPHKDPRYRPYRAAVYGVYLTVAVVFSLLVLVSVVRSVRQMTPPLPPPDDTLLSVRECVEGAETLFAELEAARRSLEQGGAARAAAVRWSDFRVRWLEKLRALQARCGPETRGRRILQPVFYQLEEVLDLYTTHAVQYAGELGPTVDRLRDSLQKARMDPSMGRMP